MPINPVVNTIVVIPCYNEEQRLDTEAIISFVETEPSTGFLLVNDGSTDRTQETLERIRSIHPNSVDVLYIPKNSGKAEAVRQGFQRSFKINPRYLGFWDADLATPLKSIRNFRDILDSQPATEMVFGARVQLLGRSIERSTFRHFSGRIFATLVSLKTGLHIYDSQCGAKLFRVSPELVSIFEEPFLSRWFFDVEIITRFIDITKNLDRPTAAEMIYEQPLESWRDIGGSKITPMTALRSLFDLFFISSND